MLLLLLAIQIVARAATPPAPIDGDRFGASVQLVRDVDGDKRSDVIVGDPSNSAHGRGSGSVWLIGSSSHTALWRVDGKREGQSLGTSLCELDDCDQDGVADFAVGGVAQFTPDSSLYGYDENLEGVVYVVSGRTGKLLHELTGEGPGDRFGWSVCTTADIDHDGLRDLVVGSPGRVWKKGTKSEQTGSVTWFSGKSYEPLQCFHSSRPGAPLGFAIACLDEREILVATSDRTSTVKPSLQTLSITTEITHRDLTCEGLTELSGVSICELSDIDHDGFADFGVCTTSHGGGRTAQRENGFFQARSSKDGHLIWEVVGSRSTSSFAESCCTRVNANVEGGLEVLVSDFNAELRGQKGIVTAYSAIRGEAVWSIEGAACFGAALSASGDFDGDGVADIAISTTERDLRGDEGLVQVFSGRTRTRMTAFTKASVEKH